MECIELYEEFISKEDADKIFDLLSELEYTNTLKTEEGDTVTIPREMMYFGDEAVEYPYANLILNGSSWKDIDFLTDLKNKIESKTYNKYNGVLINNYRDGSDTIGWHSDSEKQLGDRPTIASLNFGAERIFKFRKKEDKSIKNEFLLKNGSLFIMKDDCQEKWLHSIRRDSSIKTPRFNLTFRNYV